MMPSRSLTILTRVKSAAIKMQLQPTKQFSSKASPPPIQKVTPSERAALRSSRKQKAAQSMEQGGSSAASTSQIGGSTSTTTGATATATVTAGGKKPMDTRLVYGLGVGVPTALLAWAIADENSPPAKFATIIGVT